MAPGGQEPVRLLRIVRMLVRMRWVAAAWALLQVLTYYRPYPPGHFPAALAVVATLAAGNLAVWLGARHAGSRSSVTRLAVLSLLLDAAVVGGLVFLYTFDRDFAAFAVIYFLPLEAAALFQLRGALITMAAATAVYAVREIYGHAEFGNDLLVASITFRMGVGFVIAGAAGAMSSALVARIDELDALNRTKADYIEQVGKVTDAAAAVESERFDPAALDAVARRDDPLGQLARVFQRMASEVVAREDRLRREVRELRIEIDETRAARRVAEITESDYFLDLQAKVDQLRMRDG